MKQQYRYDTLIAKYLRGETSPEEEQDLFAWVESDEAHRRHFEQMKKVWELTHVPDWQPDVSEREEAWQRLERRLGGHAQERPPTKIFRLKTWLRVAAAIAGVCLLVWWWLAPRPTEQTHWTVYQTLPGETREVWLPDSSRVVLNGGSQLFYKLDFRPRSVRLEGEAYFEVTPSTDNPFSVQTGPLTTTVLGTAFNVRAYPGESTAEVQVIHGRVAVQSTAGEERLLEAGQGILFDSKKGTMQPSFDPNLLAWQTGKLIFVETRLDTVLTALERYSGKSIAVQDSMLLKCRFTAHLDHPDWEEVLELLTTTLGCSVERAADTVVLVGSGCR